MAGMRDKLIHDYSEVDLDILWGVVKKDVPFVKPLIHKIIKNMKNETTKP